MSLEAPLEFGSWSLGFPIAVPAAVCNNSHGQFRLEAKIMSTTFKATTLLIASLLTFLNFEASAQQDNKSIQGRMELETHDDYFKVRVFLTNKTDHDITIETGRGRQRRSVVPHFSYGTIFLQPSNWMNHPSRAMLPDPLTLKPGVEILYDTHIIPPPPRSSYSEQEKPFEGSIYFGGLDAKNLDKHTGAHYSVRLGSHKLPPLPPKPAAGRKD